MAFVMRWEGTHVQRFRVLRGQNQASIFLLTMLIIFVSDNLCKPFVYADGISLRCLSTADQQFVMKYTSCKLRGQLITNTNTSDTLGIVFSSNMAYDPHIENRVPWCHVCHVFGGMFVPNHWCLGTSEENIDKNVCTRVANCLCAHERVILVFIFRVAQHRGK